MMNTRPWLFVFLLLILLVPGEVFAVNPLYKKYLNDGWKARQAKNYSKAENYYICASKLNPKSQDARIGLLYTYIESKNFLKAEDITETLLITNPENLWVRKGAAWVFFNRGRYNDAINQYSYVLKKTGEDPEMKLGLGLSQYYAGKKRAAKKTCRECLDDFSENDPRLRLCLGMEDKPWSISPSGYVSYTDYTDSVSKDASVTATAAIEIFHEAGAGIYLQGSGMVYKHKVEDDTYQQYTSSMALFYSNPFTSLWANWSRVDGNYEGEEPGDIVTLYGSKRIGNIHIGGDISNSRYDTFDIGQYQPEIGVYLGDRYLLKVSSMIQKSSGEKALSLIEMKTRFSTALDFSASFKPVTVNLSGYYGERWFTVEDKGLHIWNGDEEFEWGGNISLGYQTDKQWTPHLSVRMDNAVKQFGVDNDFYAFGVSTGITIFF